MKNVTVSLPEDAALWVRVRAAEQNQSVSSYLASLIRELQRREDSYRFAMERYLRQAPRTLKQAGGSYPTREELHDRPGLR